MRALIRPLFQMISLGLLPRFCRRKPTFRQLLWDGPPLSQISPTPSNLLRMFAKTPHFAFFWVMSTSIKGHKIGSSVSKLFISNQTNKSDGKITLTSTSCDAGYIVHSACSPKSLNKERVKSGFRGLPALQRWINLKGFKRKRVSGRDWGKRETPTSEKSDLRF